MSRLSKQRAKEKFLQTVEIVDKNSILKEIREENIREDLYSYFIRKEAFCSGDLEEKDVNEFLLRYYSDWYFLHKNMGAITSKTLRILTEFEYSPVGLNGNKCFELVRCGKYNNILPLFLQYINTKEDKYFICVKTDELYNKDFKDFDYSVRLYINLPTGVLLDFAREFLDKAYLEEFPALLKILNNDYRFDTITIYTDYEYVEKIINVIEDIRLNNKNMFKDVGPVNNLLGKVNDYIGFGEQTNTEDTYFSSRTGALSSIQNLAGIELLKKGILAEEKKIIFKSDGSSFTVSEYLSVLIEKNIIKLIESKIDYLESQGYDNTSELIELYNMRDNVGEYIDLEEEVNELKKSFTRNEQYILDVKKIGKDNFDYLEKLFKLFTSSEDRLIKDYSEENKKDIINDQVFKITDNFYGMNTREFLINYFKLELSEILNKIIDDELNSLKRNKYNSVIANIKKRTCNKLSVILKKIVDDSDEGREYIDDLINDYVRILSTGVIEDVEIQIENKIISIDKDINNDIISRIPDLKNDINNLTLKDKFVDNILRDYDINTKNMCINKNTRNIYKKKLSTKKKKKREFYYSPEGYISRDM